MDDDWDNPRGLSDTGWLAVAVAVVAVIAAAVVQLGGAPFMLVAPMAACAAIGGAIHWVLVVKAPERPLGFWASYLIDWGLGAWLMVSFVAACRHGAWAWLGRVAERLGHGHEVGRVQPDDVFVAIAFAFFGLQALRLSEDAPWGAWLEERIPLGLLHLGIKFALLGGLLAFLAVGGEALVKGWFGT